MFRKLLGVDKKKYFDLKIIKISQSKGILN